MKSPAILLLVILSAPLCVGATESPDVFTISPGQVIKADFFNGADGRARLDMTLITEKKRELAAFTQRNLDKRVKIIVDQDTVSEPVIKDQILGGSVEIIVPSLEAGRTLVEALMSKQPPPESQEQESAPEDVPASKTPGDELVSQLDTAIQTHDRTAFAKCFNFSESEQDSRQSISRLADQVFAWPTHYVCVSNGTDTGKMHAQINGKFYTLNGDWTFCIGIYRLKPQSKGLPPSKGISFPAGVADGKSLILLRVEEKP